MEKNHKIPNSWSELPQDLMISVLGRLGFADFERAKSVCSSWHFASRKSVPNNQVPWLIFFEGTSLRLFNPEEKKPTLQNKSSWCGISKSLCRATCKSWFLMEDPRSNFYIFNLLTQEKINLPPVGSQLGMKKVKRTVNGWFAIFDRNNSKLIFRGKDIRSPVFWIDEKTKEYIVLCALGPWCVVYCKKGDNFWNQVPEISDCLCMLYKDHKLYFISVKYTFTILDFSGQIPQKTFQRGILLRSLMSSFGGSQLSDPLVISSSRYVVTITGDVLRVGKLLRTISRIESFRIFKIYLSGIHEEYERVYSLGDDTMLLDLGITVLANNEVEGLKRNCIYFSGCIHWHPEPRKLFINKLKTQKMESINKFEFNVSVSEHGERWFLPSFSHT